MLEEGRGKVRKESAWLGPAAVEEKEEAKGRAERERERERREVVDLPLYTLL